LHLGIESAAPDNHDQEGGGNTDTAGLYDAIAIAREEGKKAVIPARIAAA